MRRGYNGVAVREIVEAAGVPKGSFYNYFSSKEDFAAQAITFFAVEYVKEIESYLNETSAGVLRALDRLFRARIRGAEDHGFQYGCLVGNLAAEIADNSDACRRALVDAHASWREPFRRILDLGQREGLVRRDVPADVLADFVLNAWEGSLLRMKAERSATPLEQTRALLVDRFLPCSAERGQTLRTVRVQPRQIARRPAALRRRRAAGARLSRSRA